MQTSTQKLTSSSQQHQSHFARHSKATLILFKIKHKVWKNKQLISSQICLFNCGLGGMTNDTIVYYWLVVWASCYQGRTQGGGFGVKTPPFSLIFYKKFITCAKEINCFAYFLLIPLSTLMQIPWNKFACKFQGTLWMGQKAIITFWWEFGISSASKNHLTTFCTPSIACLILCSAIVHFIRNNCLYFVC